MANFSLTRTDIRDDVAAALKLNKSQSNIQTLINRAIDKTVNDLYRVDDFPWTWDREIIQTVADVTAGTVSINASATTVTGSSTAFTSAMVGRFIQFSSSNDWYKITAVASATSLTIESAYTQTSNLSGGTYTIRKWFYAMTANADKWMVIKQAITPVKLRTKSFRRYSEVLPFTEQTGDPQFIIEVQQGTVGTKEFTLSPFPSSVINLEVLYKKKATTIAADTDTPPMPEKYHELVVWGTIFRMSHYAGKEPGQIRTNQVIYLQEIERLKQEETQDPDWEPVIRRNDEGIGRVDDFQPVNTSTKLDGT